MKKLVVALLLVVAAMSYSMEIKRNWLEPGAKFMMGMQDKLTTMDITVPYITHDFKAGINDMFTMYAITDISYNMKQFSFDGTAADEMQNDFNLAIYPGIEMNLPNDMYLYVEPSFSMNNNKNSLFQLIIQLLVL